MILNKFPRPVLPPPPISVNPPIPYNYPNVVVYPDVNNDYEMRRKIAKYFYEIINESWITYYFSSLFKYFVIENNNVKLVKSLDNLSNKDSNLMIKNYILNKYFKRTNVEKLINKFRKINNINWWEVKKHQDKFAKFILSKLKSHLESKIFNNKK
jgi:hypothetical protein